MDLFCKLRDTKAAISLFGTEHHPLLWEVMNVKGYQDQAVFSINLRLIFEQVIYRQELGIKYESYNIMIRFNESNKNRARKEVEIRARNKQVVLPTAADELLLLNPANNLRTVGQFVCGSHNAGLVTSWDAFVDTGI